MSYSEFSYMKYDGNGIVIYNWLTFLRTNDARNLDVCAYHQGNLFIYFVIMIKHHRIEEVDVITCWFMKNGRTVFHHFIWCLHFGLLFGMSSTDVKLHESHLKACWGILHCKCMYLCTLQSDFHKGRILSFLFHYIRNGSAS